MLPKVIVYNSVSVEGAIKDFDVKGEVVEKGLFSK
jgi:hypothetical protein